VSEGLEDRIAELEGRVASLERAFVAHMGAPATPRRRPMTTEEFVKLCGDENRPKGELSRYLEESIRGKHD
jgi:hypothetical protein